MTTEHDGTCEFTFCNAFALMDGHDVVNRCGRPATKRAEVQYGDGLTYACDMHASIFLIWEKLPTSEATP